MLAALGIFAEFQKGRPYDDSLAYFPLAIDGTTSRMCQ